MKKRGGGKGEQKLGGRGGGKQKFAVEAEEEGTWEDVQVRWGLSRVESIQPSPAPPQTVLILDSLSKWGNI